MILGWGFFGDGGPNGAISGCMQPDNTFPSGSIMIVDAYDRIVDSYFVRESRPIKRKI